MGSAERQAFLNRWRFKLRPESPNRDLWEGSAAVDELARLNLLARVRVEEQDADGSGEDHYIASHAIEEICAELADYRDKVGQVRKLIEQSKDVSDWLMSLEKKVQQRINKEKGQANKEKLISIQKAIHGTVRLIAREQDNVWLQPTSVGIEHQSLTTPRIKQPLFQERELDGRFQVRLGAILRSYLQQDQFSSKKGLSLRTIARLVVLVLICADLVFERKGELFLRHNNTKVSVESVIKKLRRAQLH